MAVESVVCSIHCNEDNDRSDSQAKKDIVRDLILFKNDPNSAESKAAIQRNERWHEDVIRSSETFTKEIKHEDVFREYITSQPWASGKQVRDVCNSRLDQHAICNMKNRIRGTPTNIEVLLRNGGLRLIRRDGHETLAFGRTSAFNSIATAPLL